VPTVRLKKIKKIAMLQCTQAEAAALLDMPVDVFKRLLLRPSVRAAWDQGKQLGRVGLRRIQWRHARMYPQMAKFLGENYLEQRTREEVTNREAVAVEFDVGKLNQEERDNLRKLVELTRRAGAEES